MMFIEWSDNEKVRVTKIDNQHKKLIDIVNLLYTNLENKEIREKFLLKELINKLKIHFETEENYMKKYNYLNYISHKLEHDRCFNKVQNVMEEILNDRASLNLDFLESFKNWIYNHLELNDRKLGEFLRTKRIA